MRTVAEIAHPVFKISIFSYNAKYIVKVEWGSFEQSYKIAEMDTCGEEDVHKMITDGFLENCMKRFISMQEDWKTSYQLIS